MRPRWRGKPVLMHRLIVWSRDRTRSTSVFMDAASTGKVYGIASWVRGLGQGGHFDGGLEWQHRARWLGILLLLLEVASVCVRVMLRQVGLKILEGIDETVRVLCFPCIPLLYR